MVDSNFWHEVLFNCMGFVLTCFLVLVALVAVRYMWLVIKHWNDEWN